MKRFGPQEYLSILLLLISLFTWIISSIFRLDASSGNTEKAIVNINENLKSINETTQRTQIEMASL
jgi:thioredoxin-related protein